MRSAAAVVLFAFATAAQAHPGHAVADLWHLLTEPDHLAMILLPLAIAAVAALARRRRGRSRIRSSCPPR
jgi:hydrogenase/urease accessory protein HupE